MKRPVRQFAWLLLLGSFAPYTLEAKSVSKPKLVVVMFDDTSTCLVGDSCVDANCMSVTHSDASVAKQFEANASFRAVKPSDELVTTSENVLCLHLVLAKSDRKAIQEAVADFRNSVRDASSKAMSLKTSSMRTGEVELSLSNYFGGFWIAPSDAGEHIPRGITPATDGVITVVGTLDQDQDILLPIAACGLTFGADFGSEEPDIPGYHTQTDISSSVPGMRRSSMSGCTKSISLMSISGGPRFVRRTVSWMRSRRSRSASLVSEPR